MERSKHDAKADTCLLCFLENRKKEEAPKKIDKCVFWGKRIRNSDGSVKTELCTSGCKQGTQLDVFSCEIYGETNLVKCMSCNHKQLSEKEINEVSCKFLGAEILSEDLNLYSNENNEILFHCQKFGNTTKQKCKDCNCREAPDNKIFHNVIKPTYNFKKGVVIGTYGWPNLIELQIKTIRNNCGDIPILIADDASPGISPIPVKDSCFEKLLRLGDKYKDVTIWPNPETIGHSGGDLSAFWKGLTWAKGLGLEYLVKLSRRLVVDIPNWIEYECQMLHKDRGAIAIQKQLNKTWPFRCEGVVLRVEAWYPLVNNLLPIKQHSNKTGMFVEKIFKNIIDTKFTGIHTPLHVLRKDPRLKNPGVLWHLCNTMEDYKQIFKKYGLLPDADFSLRMSGLMKNFVVG